MLCCVDTFIFSMAMLCGYFHIQYGDGNIVNLRGGPSIYWGERDQANWGGGGQRGHGLLDFVTAFDSGLLLIICAEGRHCSGRGAPWAPLLVPSLSDVILSSGFNRWYVTTMVIWVASIVCLFTLPLMCLSVEAEMQLLGYVWTSPWHTLIWCQGLTFVVLLL